MTGWKFNKPDVDARCPKVTWNEDTVSGRPHCRQKARSLHIHRHDVWDGLLTQTLDDVLVVLHHVGGHGAVEAVGYLDCVVDGVLHQGPGWERGARHQDRAVKQAWDEVDRWWGEQYNAEDENYYRALNFNVFGTKFQLLQLSSKSDWWNLVPIPIHPIFMIVQEPNSLVLFFVEMKVFWHRMPNWAKTFRLF